MNNCTEQISDIVGIFPLLSEELEYTVPFAHRAKTIALAEMGLENLPEFLADKECFLLSADMDCVARMEIPMEKAAVAKITTQRAIQGITSAVNLQFKSPVPPYATDVIEELPEGDYDFILKVSGDIYYLLRSPAPGCTVKVEPEMGTNQMTSFTIEVNNCNGIQYIDQS